MTEYGKDRKKNEKGVATYETPFMYSSCYVTTDDICIMLIL